MLRKTAAILLSMALLLVGIALPAWADDSGYIVAVAEHTTVSYDVNTQAYTVTYTDVTAGSQYGFIVVKDHVDTPQVSEDRITYIDQAAATEAGLSFRFVPMSAPDSSVFITGKDGPVKVAELLSATVEDGVTVSGQVKSYNPKNAVALTLYKAGTKEVVAQAAIAAADGSGQATQAFSFTGVPAGTYDLVAAKSVHLAYTLKNIPVSDSDLSLKVTIQMLVGDINGDGSINGTDLNLVWSSNNYNKQASAASDPKTDINGDGSVNGTDLNIVWSSDNYNKNTANSIFEY
jgi:hypothetical protein